MNNLVRAEWFKLRKDRSFHALIWILLVLSLLNTANAIYGRVFHVDEFYAGEVLGINFQIMQLIPCVLAGFFISGEYTMGTMKSVVSSGNSRTRVYLAKLIVFMVGAMILSVLPLIAMTGSGAIYAGFTGLPDGAFYFQTVALTALYAAAFGSIMTLFATLFTESGKSIGFSLIFFMFFDELLHMLSGKFAFLEPVWNYSVFKMQYDIANVGTLDSGQWTKLLVVPVATLIIFGWIGCSIFQRKEIK